MFLALTFVAACAPTLSFPADAGPLDTEEPDAGEPDAGGTDAGEPDAGSALADFTLDGIRLDDVGGIGKRIRAIVERESDGARVGELDQPITAGNETFHIAGIIAEGESYAVRLYIDLDGDLQCGPPPPLGSDFGFQSTGLLGESSGLEVYFHTGWVSDDVCESFP